MEPPLTLSTLDHLSLGSHFRNQFLLKSSTVTVDFRPELFSISLGKRLNLVVLKDMLEDVYAFFHIVK